MRFSSSVSIVLSLNLYANAQFRLPPHWLAIELKMTPCRLLRQSTWWRRTTRLIIVWIDSWLGLLYIKKGVKRHWHQPVICNSPYRLYIWSIIIISALCTYEASKWPACCYHRSRASISPKEELRGCRDDDDWAACAASIPLQAAWWHHTQLKAQFHFRRGPQ